MRNLILVLFYFAMLAMLVFMIATGVGADEPTVYNEVDAAVQKHMDTGKPLVMVMGADWCVWCKKQKQELTAAGKLAFDWNYFEHTLLEKYKVSKSIPQLVIYKRGKWKTYVGFKKVKDIEKLISNQ